LISYEAALIAEFIRENLLRLGKRVTFETVFSHESKIKILDFANQNGYKNYLYFVGTKSPLINIKRVKQRVMLGGHSVDSKIIEDRYYRSMGFLKEAVLKTYRSFIFDNSGKGTEPKLIVEVFKGNQFVYHHSSVPKWIDRYLLNK